MKAVFFGNGEDQQVKFGYLPPSVQEEVYERLTNMDAQVGRNMEQMPKIGTGDELFCVVDPNGAQQAILLSLSSLADINLLFKGLKDDRFNRLRFMAGNFSEDLQGWVAT